MLEQPTSVEPPPSKKARVSSAEADAPVQRGKGASNTTSTAHSNGADVVLPMRPTEGMPKLIAAGVLGMHGFCLLDLFKQEYQQPPKNAKSGEADVSASSSVDPPPTKRLSVIYPSVKHAMAVDWTVLTPRVPPFYCALQLLCDLQAASRSPPATLARLRPEPSVTNHAPLLAGALGLGRTRRQQHRHRYRYARG